MMPDRLFGKVASWSESTDPTHDMGPLERAGMSPVPRDAAPALQDPIRRTVRLPSESNGIGVLESYAWNPRPRDPRHPSRTSRRAVAHDERFVYDWDEVGRLARARRWDLPAPGAASDGTASVDLAYTYDSSDDRVLKAATDPNNNTVFTAYIFPSLELRRTVAEGADYVRNNTTEVVYLEAHGVRLARLHEGEIDETLPAPGGETLHILLEMPDHLGSTSIVVDRDTSEVVERGTYMAYGQAESDYRPTRWASFREDYRFTGKEEDVEVGLAYFGKRYYAPGLNRWVSPDPLALHGLDADANVYAYVHGQLLRLIDKIGLEGEPKDAGAPAARGGDQDVAGAADDGTQDKSEQPAATTMTQTSQPAAPSVPSAQPPAVQGEPPARAAPARPPLDPIGPNLTLTLRSYAPFTSFGGGFHGDSRGPSTSPYVSARITTSVQFDVNANASHTTTFADPSAWPEYDPIVLNVPGAPPEVLPQFQDTDTAKPTATATVDAKDDGVVVNIAHAGSMPLLPSPDIDVQASVRFQRGPGDSVVVTTRMQGDAFPNAEVFVTLPSGERVMLHHFETSAGPLMGPYTRLWGNFQRNMGTSQVTIRPHTLSSTPNGGPTD